MQWADHHAIVHESVGERSTAVWADRPERSHRSVTQAVYGNLFAVDRERPALADGYLVATKRYVRDVY